MGPLESKRHSSQRPASLHKTTPARTRTVSSTLDACMYWLQPEQSTDDVWLAKPSTNLEASRDEKILSQLKDRVISLVHSAELLSGCWDKSPQGMEHIWCFSLPVVLDTCQVTVGRRDP